MPYSNKLAILCSDKKNKSKKNNKDGHMFRLLISHAFTGENSVVVENVDIEDLDFDLIEEACTFLLSMASYG